MSKLKRNVCLLVLLGIFALSGQFNPSTTTASNLTPVPAVIAKATLDIVPINQGQFNITRAQMIQMAPSQIAKEEMARIWQGTNLNETVGVTVAYAVQKGGDLSVVPINWGLKDVIANSASFCLQACIPEKDDIQSKDPCDCTDGNGN